jgi:hypothetical protein
MRKVTIPFADRPMPEKLDAWVAGSRPSFYRAQAASQRVEMFEQIRLATELSHEFARRLREAGNITLMSLR